MPKYKSLKLVEYDLLKLSNPKIWKRLRELTLPYGIAVGVFEEIEARGYHGYERFKICLLKVNNRIVAWACVNQLAGMKYSNIWAFTDPQYRNKGLQKDYLMPYWAKREPKCGYQNDNERRKRTFAAYERAKKA